ncbi:hypothetical protein QYF36_019041 [Acer negundo]|nr:hypothetical protein QYF36_019041 [Acer negundo]
MTKAKKGNAQSNTHELISENEELRDQIRNLTGKVIHPDPTILEKIMLQIYHNHGLKLKLIPTTAPAPSIAASVFNLYRLGRGGVRRTTRYCTDQPSLTPDSFDVLKSLTSSQDYTLTSLKESMAGPNRKKSRF